MSILPAAAAEQHRHGDNDDAAADERDDRAARRRVLSRVLSQCTGAFVLAAAGLLD